MSTFWVFNEHGAEQALKPYVERRFAEKDRVAAHDLIMDFLRSPEAAKLRGESEKT